MFARRDGPKRSLVCRARSDPSRRTPGARAQKSRPGGKPGRRGALVSWRAFYALRTGYDGSPDPLPDIGRRLGQHVAVRRAAKATGDFRIEGVRFCSSAKVKHPAAGMSIPLFRATAGSAPRLPRTSGRRCIDLNDFAEPARVTNRDATAPVETPGGAPPREREGPVDGIASYSFPRSYAHGIGANGSDLTRGQRRTAEVPPLTPLTPCETCRFSDAR